MSSILSIILENFVIDCTVDIISWGEILESLKVNYSASDTSIGKASQFKVPELLTEGEIPEDSNLAKSYAQNKLAGIINEDQTQLSGNGIDAAMSAKKALEIGRSGIVCFNAADEIFVNAFLSNKIGFTQITDNLDKILDKAKHYDLDSIESVVEYDKYVKSLANDLINA